MFFKRNTLGIIIHNGLLATVALAGGPAPSTVTPNLVVGYVDSSGVAHETTVVDNVTTITGKAPFSVEFLGYGSVSQQADSNTAEKAFWDLGFLFNYGENLGTTWSLTGLAKDTDRGIPVTAHTYTTVGTHQARMTCRDSAGNQAFVRVNVVVTDPGAGVDMTSGVIPTWVSGTTYNAPAGGTWGATNFSGLHDIIIRKTGAGADPVFGAVTLEGDAQTSGTQVRAAGIRFQNCDVAQVQWFGAGMSYCSFVGGRVRMVSLPYMMYYADQAAIGTAALAANTKIARGLFLQDTGELNDSGAGYVMIGDCRSLHFKNVYSRKTTSAQHNIRGTYRNSSFRHCLLNNSVAGSVSYWKFQGWMATLNLNLPTYRGDMDEWQDNDTVATGAGGRRLGLPCSHVAVVDSRMGLSGSDQPAANAGFGPENNDVDAAEGSEFAGFEHCSYVWTNQWYTLDLSGRYLGRRDVKLTDGAGAEINVAAGVNHPNRTPIGWEGPYFTTGTRPVVVP